MTIGPAALRKSIENADSLTLLDVRTPAEFGSGHIAGSRNVPLNELRGRVAEFSSAGEPIVLICRSGVRARTADRILREAGVRDPRILEGGVLAWRASGGVVERDPGATTGTMRRAIGVAAIIAAVAFWKEQPALTLVLAIVGARMALGQPVLPCTAGGSCRMQ